MHRCVLAVACCCVALALGALAEAPSGTAAAAKMSAKEDFQLFLLVGQSNMAGRGTVAAEDKEVHPRVFMLTQEGVWKPAVDPVHYDKPGTGVGPGRSFALALAEANPDTTIGLVPAACGGSPIDAWQPGEYWGQTKSHPYDDAIARAKRAMKDGVLKGILWHQGEGDCSEERAPVYEAKLRALIARFRKDLGAPDVPFLIGQLGQTPPEKWTTYRQQVDAAQKAVAESDAHGAFVPSDGFTLRADKTHFDAPSQRTFGRRYAEAYTALLKKNP